MDKSSEGAINKTNISDNCCDDDVNNCKHVDPPTSNSPDHMTISDGIADNTSIIANKTDEVAVSSNTSCLESSQCHVTPSHQEGHCNKNDSLDQASPSTTVITDSYALLLASYNSASDSDSDSSDSDDFCNISKNATDNSNNATSISTQSNGDVDEDSNVIITLSGESSSNRNYRNNSRLSSGSSDSESDSSSENEGAKCNRQVVKKDYQQPNPFSKELNLDKLPPVDLSKLSLTVDKKDCIQMGKIISIIEKLVVIESLPNIPAYDLDTVLFLNEGSDILGQVYEAIGSINNPTYLVRFNSEAEIVNKGISKGLPVYSAPDSEHCKYVLLQDLLNKGTDASWIDDQECPQEYQEISDDEKEKMANQAKNEIKKRKRKNTNKHKIFEATMNFKNKLDTARHKIRDPIVNTTKQSNQPSCQPVPYYYNMSAPTPVVNSAAPQNVRPQCAPGYVQFPSSFATPPPPFNYVGMHPGIPVMNFSPFPNQFGPRMAPFPGNYQQYPPPNFCAPNIPPMTAHHMVPQSSPMQTYPGSTPPVPPQHMLPVNTSKHLTNISKSPPKNGNQTGGVVPKNCKSRSPRSYNSPPQPTYQPNVGLPNPSMSPYSTLSNMPPGIPTPFGSPMGTWAYNIPNQLPPPNQPPPTQPPPNHIHPSFQYGIPYQKH